MQQNHSRYDETDNGGNNQNEEYAEDTSKKQPS